MGLRSFVKKVFRAPVRIVKAIVDPVLDFATNTFKAIISPFTGGFDLPDVSVNVDAGTNEIKAATSVDFSAANRAVPVLYGHKIESGTIPVFIGTFGDNSADTSRQYLYMAAIISQGFHGSHAEAVDPGMGSLLSRMTINGKPVHLGGITNTANPNYSQGYDGSTALNLQEADGGIFASGKGGVQPAQHSITKGTFANRLKIQYFDGSADQPVSSLLNEHPEWSPTGQSKLSGMHYVALRFLIQAADVTVGGSDGNGTFGNPYSGLPAVVTTTSGRNTPNIMSGNAVDPGYTEKSYPLFSEPATNFFRISHHKPLGVPNADGILGGVDNVDKHTETVESDTTIQYERYRYFQPTKEVVSHNPQTVNIHDILFKKGWTYPFVYFLPGSYTYNSDSSSDTPGYGDEDRGQWLKHVGGSHYQFVSKATNTLLTTVADSTLTFFAYDSNMTEAIINGVTPAEQTGDSTTAEYRWYGTQEQCQLIANGYKVSPNDDNLRIRDYDAGTTQTYKITAINEANISDAAAPFLTLGLHNEDSSAVGSNFYTTVPIGAEVTIEQNVNSLANKDKISAQWETAFADNVYLTEGLPYQAYTCDSNPVEMLLDYLLNPNYGVGVSVHDIDKKSFQLASIACDTIPSYYDFDNTQFFMGGGGSLNVFDRNEYMYGEGATTGSSANGSSIQTMNNSYDRIYRIDTNRTHLENINTILASIGATMPVIDGKFHLQLENAGIPDASEAIPPVTALPITATITDDHVIDGITVATSSVNDKFNQIKIDYTSIIDNSQPASVMSPDPVEDSTSIRVNYLAEDNNKKLEGNFSFPSIYDEVSAKKIATLLLKKSRGQPIVNLTASAIAMGCVPGDFVRVTSDRLKMDDVYRVTAATVNEDHTVALSCIRHVPEFYDITDEGQTFEARRDIMDLK
tara:strand:+ start:21712 stop:24453 length:2742 start_codon:yes stop_codon:yes gene_type:complete